MGEKMVIVGVRDVSFTDDRTGRVVDGKTFYYTQPRDGVRGVCADKLFVSAQALRDISYEPIPGDEVIAYFNRFGKVASFSLVE